MKRAALFVFVLAASSAAQANVWERAIERLRTDGTRYVVVHFGEFEPERRAGIFNALVTRYGMAQLASFVVQGAHGSKFSGA